MWEGEKLARCPRDIGLGDGVREAAAGRRVFQTETALDTSRLANVHTPSRSAKIRIFLGSPTLLCSGEACACLFTIDRSLHVEQPLTIDVSLHIEQSVSA